jgi:hypothetical protein
MTTRTALLTCFALLIAGRVEAQSGGPYSLTWSNSGGGGQVSATGGTYKLGGTVGQPDAPRITGGIYALNGGFWTPAAGGAVDAPPADPIPKIFAARPAFPNPFRTSTTVAFDLPAARQVELTLYGIDGRVVRRLMDGAMPIGRHRAVWDGRDDRGQPVASGIYFVRIRAGEFTSTLRVVRLD